MTVGTDTQRTHTALQGQFFPQLRTWIKQSLFCTEYPDGGSESTRLKIHMLPQNNWLNIWNYAEKGFNFLMHTVSHNAGPAQAQHAHCHSSTLESSCWVHQPPPLAHAPLFWAAPAQMWCLCPVHIDLQVSHSISKNIKRPQDYVHMTCMNLAHTCIYTSGSYKPENRM